ncbi:MAG: peptidoglycan editing factor PgeF [Paracoccaceae bacterium]|nr:peptidoglycan editing factor PgeF [Paracoccaceae bacterium]
MTAMEILTASPLAGVTHGFFTRNGGVSTGIFRSLNCGPGSSDDPESVMINRSRAGAALGIDPANVVSLHQIHSNETIEISTTPADRIRADAMVSRNPDILLGILSADCAPVLFASPTGSVVGAAHAGWKGALGGILESALRSMTEFGVDIPSITAVVGPCISQAAYEVGPEFRRRFLSADPGYRQFFVPGKGDRFRFDLPGFCLERLQRAGVRSVSWTGNCTYDDVHRFFSYRRSVHRVEPDYGRQISAIRAG